MVSEVGLIDLADEDGIPLLFGPVRHAVVVDGVGGIDGSGSMVDEPFVLLDPVGESVGVLLNSGVVLSVLGDPLDEFELVVEGDFGGREGCNSEEGSSEAHILFV